MENSINIIIFFLNLPLLSVKYFFYRRQVHKVRDRLIMKGLQEVTVGTVEEFQGQERSVMIVSTVRSSPQYLATDGIYKLGFLANPKRFNVAITQAKALLVVVGNPYILAQVFI